MTKPKKITTLALYFVSHSLSGIVYKLLCALYWGIPFKRLLMDGFGVELKLVIVCQ